MLYVFFGLFTTDLAVQCLCEISSFFLEVPVLKVIDFSFHFPGPGKSWQTILVLEGPRKMKIMDS